MVRPFASVSPGNEKRTSAPSTASNETKKPFQYVAEPSVSVSAGQPLNKTTSTPRLTRNTTDRRNQTGSQDSIKILVWTDKPEVKYMRQCDTPVPCVYTYDHSLYNVSDAFMLTTRFIRDRQHMPSYRPPHQHWINFQREAQVNFKFKVKPYETWFIWTVAYSMNGDVVLPYGVCLPTRDKVAKDPNSITDRVYDVSTGILPSQCRG